MADERGVVALGAVHVALGVDQKRPRPLHDSGFLVVRQVALRLLEEALHEVDLGLEVPVGPIRTRAKLHAVDGEMQKSVEVMTVGRVRGLNDQTPTPTDHRVLALLLPLLGVGLVHHAFPGEERAQRHDEESDADEQVFPVEIPHILHGRDAHEDDAHDEADASNPQQKCSHFRSPLPWFWRYGF